MSLHNLISDFQWHIEDYPGDIEKYRDVLEKFVSDLRQKLDRPLVHLSIKPVSGADYVYGNYGQEQVYIGKHVPNPDRKLLLEELEEPHPFNFRLMGKKLTTARETRKADISKHKLTKQEMTRFYGERLGGRIECPDTIEYDYVAFNVARANYQDQLTALQSDIGKLAQVTRLGGILKLQRLQNEGYLILPLK